MPLGEAIEANDAVTGAYPLHYMINCAHPTHFDHVLDPAAPWAHRIGGIRANASALSHAELDEMVELDEGDPDDLARRYVALRDLLPSLHVVGGCCATDHATAPPSRRRGNAEQVPGRAVRRLRSTAHRPSFVDENSNFATL